MTNTPLRAINVDEPSQITRKNTHPADTYAIHLRVSRDLTQAERDRLDGEKRPAEFGYLPSMEWTGSGIEFYSNMEWVSDNTVKINEFLAAVEAEAAEDQQQRARMVEEAERQQTQELERVRALARSIDFGA